MASSNRSTPCYVSTKAAVQCPCLEALLDLPLMLHPTNKQANVFRVKDTFECNHCVSATLRGVKSNMFCGGRYGSPFHAIAVRSDMREIEMYDIRGNKATGETKYDQ